MGYATVKGRKFTVMIRKEWEAILSGSLSSRAASVRGRARRKLSQTLEKQ